MRSGTNNYPGIAVALCALLLTVSAGCNRNPVNKLVNPTLNNTIGNPASGWTAWTLYDDELKTGGTVMAYTTSEGQVTNFSSTDHPHSGKRCIKYSWDGSDVTQYSTGEREHGFVGMALIVANDVNAFTSTAKDLVPSQYSTLSFWARGTLNANVHLQIKGPSAFTEPENNIPVWTSSATVNILTASWQRFSLPINTISLANVNDYAKIILQYDVQPSTAPRGNGGTVFLDDIELMR